MKNMLYIAVLVFFFGCASSKKTTSESKEVTKTLTFTEETKLDTIVFIPAEKASLFIPINRLKVSENTEPKVFTKQNGRATITAKLDATGINITGSCDSIAKQLSIYKKRVKQYQFSEKELKSKEKEKKGYTFFQLLLSLIAVAITAFVAGYFTQKFKFKIL